MLVATHVLLRVLIKASGHNAKKLTNVIHSNLFQWSPGRKITV